VKRKRKKDRRIERYISAGKLKEINITALPVWAVSNTDKAMLKKVLKKLDKFTKKNGESKSKN
jgi:hypothetical protein